MFAEFIEHGKGKLGHLARMCFVILVTLTDAVQKAELLLFKLVGIIFAGFRADVQKADAVNKAVIRKNNFLNRHQCQKLLIQQNCRHNQFRHIFVDFKHFNNLRQVQLMHGFKQLHELFRFNADNAGFKFNAHHLQQKFRFRACQHKIMYLLIFQRVPYRTHRT